MSAPVPEEVASLRRRLWVYRGLVLVLSVALVVLLVAVRRALAPAPDPDVEVVDVPARFEALARAHPEAADVAETYYFGDGATVHLHAMGNGQTCPLHIHRKTHEATVIVAGQAGVTQVWGRDGQLMRKQDVYGPGRLIGSAPFTGHEWRNPAADRMLGNLVFATPRFDGNLYVGADDARMLGGTEPFSYDPAAELADLRGKGLRQRVAPLPVLEGRMSGVLLEDEAQALPATRTEPVVVYVASGAGTMEAPESRPVKEGQLWVLRREARVRAASGSPLALYMFRPPASAPEP